jgi:hypothetical protein
MVGARPVSGKHGIVLQLYIHSHMPPAAHLLHHVLLLESQLHVWDI